MPCHSFPFESEVDGRSRRGFRKGESWEATGEPNDPWGFQTGDDSVSPERIICICDVAVLYSRFLNGLMDVPACVR